MKIHNRGRPPLAVVKEIMMVVKDLPESVIERSERADDIFTSIAPQLGPWRSNLHRRAALANTLVVLAGYESSWNYNSGRDMSADNTSACTKEAGMFQTSGNANYFDSSLGKFQMEKCGTTDCLGFQACSKQDGGNFSKDFVIGHTARLLRFTIRHHGPLVRKEVNSWLSKECTAQIEKFY